MYETGPNRDDARPSAESGEHRQIRSRIRERSGVVVVYVDNSAALLLAKEVLADADAATDATAKAELMGKVVMLRTMFMVMAGQSP
jgi:RNase H-fold protein (predicted Holliday junction resolvase)